MVMPLSRGAAKSVRASCVPPPELMNVCPEDTMTQYPYILFNKSPEQLRRLGARGDRASAERSTASRASFAGIGYQRISSRPAQPPNRCLPTQDAASTA
jgi:hypothetical protein